MLVNGDGRLMAVLHCPDDVLRTPCRVAAEEHTGARALHGHLVDDRHAPLVERDADVALDPRERVVLTDGENDLVARQDDGAGHGADLLAVLLAPHELLELHADELSILDHKPPGRVILDDVDRLFLRVLELPRRRLEIGTRATRAYSRRDAAMPPRGAAAIHGGVAHADDEHAWSVPVDVPAAHGAEPLEADVDVTPCGVVPAAGDVEVRAFRRDAADVHRVEAAG